MRRLGALTSVFRSHRAQTALLALAVFGLAWADGPSVPYRWVKPPPHLKATNVAPGGVRAEKASGSVATPDGQAIVTLPAGVTGDVEIEPLDPARLAGVPDPDLAPDGNAYRVSVPPGADGGGSIALTAPYAPQALLFSPDGKRWRPIEGARVVGSEGYGGPIAGPGYYLVASAPQPPVQGLAVTDRRRWAAIAGAAVLGVAGFLALFWPTLLRSRGEGET